MDAGASEWFPRSSVTSTLHLAPAAPLLAPTPSPWPTSPVLSPLIHLARRLVVVRHICSAPKAFNIAHARLRASKAYTWYSAALGSSSLIDTVTSSQLVWDVHATINKPPITVFTDYWQQTLSVWVDVLILPACQHLSSMHAHMPVPLYPFDDVLGVL